ncbi:MAG: glycosyltransferase family 39 protein [Burkholderiales bacterium]|nr:glycosyltransferase family 39 protein [Burkholderiales bacterium]
MSTALPRVDDPLAGAAAHPRRRFHVRLSAATTAVLLGIAWILPGLVGHEPWKPDEAAAIGIVRNLMTGNGNWVVPRLAGEAALDAPPLVYLAAAGFAKLFSGLLPLHDAARLASGVFMALAFWFTALTAKELYGRDYAGIAVIGLLGCVGWIVRAHQLIPDVPLVTGLSLGLYGLAVAPRRPLLGGAALGTGIGIGFLARGLVGPIVLIATALLFAMTNRQWKLRALVATLGGACVAAAPWLVVWPLALYRQSPDLFHEWLTQDLVGALFFGGARPTLAWREYLVLLPWFAWPVLPLAIWTLWHGRRGLPKRPDLQLPLIALVVMFALLGLVSNAGDVYALPLLVPFTLLAVASLDTLRRGAISALDWFGIMTFGLIAILLWIAWVALLTGWPPGIARALAAFQPGFEGHFHWLPFLIAAVSTLLWAALVARTMPTTRRALVNWGGGITLMWILASTLWLPYVDAGKSYRGVVRELELVLPKGSRCISSIGLGDSQRAMLEYYGGIITHREEIPQPKRDCDLLLTQGTALQQAAVGSGWTKIWEGARPGDTKERFRLYKRTAAKKS